jgi:hypothetical protein
MKPEDQAWVALRADAAARLRAGFAERIVRAAHGPSPGVWQQLVTAAAARLRPGFAERVLRAARAAADMPSFASQLALSAATVALCLGAVLFHHHRQIQLADARNLAEWQAIVAVAQDFDATGR